MNRTALISRTLAVVCLTAAALPSVAQPLAATEVFSWDPTQIVRQVRIDRSGLDLTSSRDMATLLVRIESAAAGACGGQPLQHDDYARKAFEACRDDAISGAVRSLHSRPLRALAADRRDALLARR